MTRTGCAVTKSRERKPPVYGGLWPVPKALHGNVEQQIAGHLKMKEKVTGNQSGRRAKHTVRRLTNVRRHCKGKPIRITAGLGRIRLRRPCVRCGKSDIIKEESGQMHLVIRRCKRRWHVCEDLLSTLGEPAWFSLSGDIKRRIRRNAEIRSDVMLGVGDGHISEDCKDNKTLPIQRTISRRTCQKINKGQQMIAEKAKKTSCEMCHKKFRDTISISQHSWDKR